MPRNLGGTFSGIPVRREGMAAAVITDHVVNGPWLEPVMGERGEGGRREGREKEEEEEPASIEKSSCIPEAPFALVAFQNDDSGEGMGQFKNILLNELILTAQLIQSYTISTKNINVSYAWKRLTNA